MKEENGESKPKHACRCDVKNDSDPVSHPPHYTNHPSGIECIQIVEHMGFCLGNVIKYVWRADSKGGLEDLMKAEWYLKREIKSRIIKQGINDKPCISNWPGVDVAKFTD